MSYNLTAGTETPVKEKSQERELLPNLRPNTEDFLTFLCFRGTNSLPKELDFQNTLNQPSTSGTSGKASKLSPEKKVKDNKSEVKKKVGAKKNETVTSEKKLDVAKASNLPEKDPKTGFMPFAVRKRAEIHPAKNDKKKLQNVTKKKQQVKPDNALLNDSSETSNGPRTTRANPIEERPAENRNNNTKINKRKTQSPESSLPAAEIALSKVPVSSKGENAIKTGSNKKISKLEEDKRRTRLSAIKTPPKSMPKEKLGNGTKSPSFDKYFSSSDGDDEPLVKSEPKNKKAKLNESTAKSNANVSDLLSASKNASLNSTLDSSMPVKSNRGRKKKIVVQPEPEKLVELEKVDTSIEKKKVGRKKKINVDLEIANSQANTTDLSENEARGRPMRKTKEAATIYMELIGRKLTLQDSSDNDSSLDSLEVPNLKRVELLENELKANCEKAKEVEAEKIKQENIKVRRVMLNNGFKIIFFSILVNSTSFQANPKFKKLKRKTRHCRQERRTQRQ